MRSAGGFSAVSRVRASPQARQGPKAHQGARGPSALRTLRGEASPGEGVDRGQSSDERTPPSREGAATRSPGRGNQPSRREMNYCGQRGEEERSCGGHVNSISTMGRLEQEIMSLGLSTTEEKSGMVGRGSENQLWEAGREWA